MASASMNQSPRDSPHGPAVRRWYLGALLFAAVLGLLPAGCCLVDAGMWFINGLAVAVYGAGMGVAAGSRRGIAVATACGILGVTHPIWVFGSIVLNAISGVPHAAPFSTLPMTVGQVAADNALLFVWTGLVFGMSLAACARSIAPALAMAVSSVLAAAVVRAGPWLIGTSPLGGLWPSTFGAAAAVLHVGIATSLWRVLRHSPGRRIGAEPSPS